MLTSKQKAVLVKRLDLIIAFINKPTEYKYVNSLTNELTLFNSLQDFPSEIHLLTQDKDIRQHYFNYDAEGNRISLKYISKTDLDIQVWSYLKEQYKTWEYFTGDFAYPLPDKVGTNQIPLYCWYRNKSNFYIKSKDIVLSFYLHLRQGLDYV